jgi:probable rRNA maturation factor
VPVVLALIVDRDVRGRLTVIETAELKRRLTRMVRAVALNEPRKHSRLIEPLELSVRLTGDAAIRSLNRDFRGRDYPTDVLAFSQREGETLASNDDGLLGDVVISLDAAERQCRNGLFAEVLFLAAHGLCHLIGYDHNTDAEEAQMNVRVVALLAEAERRGPGRPA